MKEYKIKFLNQDLFLHPERVLYWYNQDILLVADLHLGKAGHFRKAGIPVPKDIHKDDINRLSVILQHYRPKTVLILGDLFHSELNSEWNEFKHFIQNLQVDSIQLILGNHDILAPEKYSGMIVHRDQFVIPPFVFSHQPINGDFQDDPEEVDSISSLQMTEYNAVGASSKKTDDLNNLYNVCGHIHPGVRIKMGLRQSIRRPCFYFGKKHAILPAFGIFTGSFVLNPGPDDSVYAIVEERIIHLKTEKF